MFKKIVLLLLCFSSFYSISQETFKVGKTEYYYDQYYATTGNAVVKRSEANKKEFLKSRGFTQLPEGFEIDHIKPLCEGGSDDPSNMQILTVEQHKRKTARERTNRSTNTSYSSFCDKPTVTRYDNYGDQIATREYSGKDDSGRTIYKGSRGGEYYLTSSGNKVYVKNSSPTYYAPSKSSSTSSSSTSNSNTSTREIHTGPRGGTYYINSNGNKTYTKK